MAFLKPHFDPDVFVSYSHGMGPRGIGSPLKVWTHQLIDDVEQYLHAYREDEEFLALDIWRDSNIDPTADLTDELRLKVRSAGILMIIMSPRYLSSSWCRDELEWFRDQIEGRRKHRGRVVVVRAFPTDTAAWPEFLRDEYGHGFVGFQFHDSPPNSLPYAVGGSSLNHDKYIQQVNSLVSTLKRRLSEIRTEYENTAQRKTALPLQTGGVRRIYLHIHHEHTAAGEELRRILSDAGLLPMAVNAGRGIIDIPKDTRLRINAMKLCEVLILFRQADDDNFDDDLCNIGGRDRDRAQSDRGSPLPCAIIDQSGQPLPFDIPDIAHFDMRQEDWQSKLFAWLDTHRASARQEP